MAALVAVLAALAGPQPAEAAARETPFGFLGAAAGAPLTDGVRDLDREFGVMARNGVESARLALYWSLMQPQEGGPVDFSRTDVVVAAAARSGISLLTPVLGAPEWARIDPADASSPPREPAEYGRFMVALVDRYGSRGSFWDEHPDLPRRPLRDWEIWNEPNNPGFWRLQPFAKRYVALLREAHRVIKARDGRARVILAGFATPVASWPVLRQVYDAGGRGHFDIVSIHPYTRDPRNVERLVRLARERLRRLDDARRPLWATEITWPASRGRVDSDYGFEVGTAQQTRNIADIIPRLAAQRRRLRLGRVYWESWVTTYRHPSNAFDYSGLRSLAADGTLSSRPGLTAFRRAARRLQGCAKTTDARRCSSKN